MRRLAVCALLPLAACVKQAEQKTEVTYVLDCTPGFERLKAKITAAPGIVQAPKEAGEPYEWYTSADQATSYVITEPGAPGHPAIVMERAAGGQELTMGCHYGDDTGYKKLVAYVEGLKGVRK